MQWFTIPTRNFSTLQRWWSHILTCPAPSPNIFGATNFVEIPVPPFWEHSWLWYKEEYRSTTSCYSILHWGKKSYFMWPSALRLQMYYHSKGLLGCVLSPTLKAFPDMCIQKECKQLYQCLKRKEKKLQSVNAIYNRSSIQKIQVSK